MKKTPYFWLGLVLLTIFVGSCAESESNINSFINETQKRKPKPLPPLPEFKPPKPYQFTSGNLRNPFQPYVESVAVVPQVQIQGPGPDTKRPKEPLEKFSLDSLKMVGTITKRNGELFALVKEPEPTSTVRIVGIGNYMGLNYGKIEKITETTIEVREWTGSQGRYSQRDVTMHLSSK